MDVTLLSTGGTIASTDADGGARPTRTGAELLEAVPELESHASLSVDEVAQVPSFEMDAETLETVGERVRELEADPTVDAVVITHGTDTMEETAYYLDVTVQPETPVFLTGAQRRPDEVSSDGPSNLLTAVRAAEAFVDRDAGGTFIAFNETVHSARSVTKTHTSALEAFRSRNAGPVATVDRNGVAIHRRPRSETRLIDATSLEATVYTIKSGSAVTGDLVAAALERGADGLVVEGTGLGNVTAGLADAARDAIEAGVPVVVTSRCLEGRVAPVYGGDGGGEQLREYGAIFANDLTAQQARLRLALALEASDDEDAIREAFSPADSQT
ncbi:Asparaginase/glutaminase [Haloterrigena turkmenica DSM 5511]|uniref:L-asparaginase n=1 Tax=Haloterrigena turkmenica (strain ATCC 51198 / DSM 5511 / JCM 9101 / NCIMB 13204 / VKM B-1734 / 4k) TaxID=543526 RepID=D2RSV6_HALTV|nr:asparaginase [Haloterrigena turkmenica]ADB58930.1 Asparaginase/glutaminase [Haloterrigena turkmenica DSM 5511]